MLYGRFAPGKLHITAVHGFLTPLCLQFTVIQGINMAMYKLENTIQEYQWGSDTWIPELLSMANPEKKPMAELWMGAHPKAPSRLIVHERGTEVLSSGETLAEIVQKRPVEVLGERVAGKFDDRLPFLFKVLAAGKPLSIQAHPDKTQAEEGFERENRDGVPLDAFHRNYRDDNHKPEIICALTDFHAMLGFRHPGDIMRDFSLLPGLDRLEKVLEFPVGSFFASDGDIQGIVGHREKDLLMKLMSSLLSLTGSGAEEIVQIASKGVSGRSELRFQWVSRLADIYPGDIGVLSPLFLNVLKLSPGEAAYLPPGELHAYLHGLGVELMANSDNVLRGGLTPKHVDKDELLHVLTFSPFEAKPLVAERDGGVSEMVYMTPAAEFRLSVIEMGGTEVYRKQKMDGPEIILCIRGSADIAENGSSGDGTGLSTRSKLHLEKGESCIIFDSTPGYTVTGDFTLYKAAVP